MVLMLYKYYWFITTTLVIPNLFKDFDPVQRLLMDIFTTTLLVIPIMCRDQLLIVFIILYTEICTEIVGVHGLLRTWILGGLACTEFIDRYAWCNSQRKLAWLGHVTHYDSLFKTVLQGTLEGERRRGLQRNCWMDNIKAWTSLSVPELLTMASNRRDWKWISAGLSLTPPPPPHPRRPNRSRDSTLMIPYWYN